MKKIFTITCDGVDYQGDLYEVVHINKVLIP